MTWTKTADDHPDRRLDQSDAAYRLEHAALTYSNRLLLDGRIPKAALRMLPVPDSCLRPRVVRELIESGRWLDNGDAFTVVGYFEGQLSRDEVEKQREYDAVRQRIRFANKRPDAAQTLPGLRAEEKAAKLALWAAREERKAISHRESQRNSQGESQHVRPVPAPVPVPSHTKTRTGTRNADQTADPQQTGHGGPRRSFKELVGWTPPDATPELLTHDAARAGR